MRKLFSAAAVVVAVLCTSIASVAHDPPDVLRLLWQWPANQVPVLDADLSEWSIIPDDYTVTPADMHASFDAGEWVYVASADYDLASLDFKVIPSYVDGQSRIYYMHERFDDAWTLEDDLEVGIDGDHTGGWFANVEGQSQEEIDRTRGRQAQTWHTYFDDGLNRGSKEKWNWFWLTKGDWQEQPPWTDVAYGYDGTPGAFLEGEMWGEFYLTVWDDYNWQDPDGSIQHTMREGEIIGHIIHQWDFDGNEENYFQAGCECGAFWSDNTRRDTNDASSFVDYLLDEPRFDLLPTAVEESSWGAIKASVR